MSLKTPSTLTLWLALVAASVGSYSLGEQPGNSPLPTWAMALVFGLALFKGWLVIDHFMALRLAPPLWRRLVLGCLWAVVVCVALVAILTA